MPTVLSIVPLRFRIDEAYLREQGGLRFKIRL